MSGDERDDARKDWYIARDGLGEKIPDGEFKRSIFEIEIVVCGLRLELREGDMFSAEFLKFGSFDRDGELKVRDGICGYALGVSMASLS
jgi:hypothetical protein